MDSAFAFVSGESDSEEDIQLRKPEPAQGSIASVLHGKLQWKLIPDAKQPGYSLFSIAYPGIDVEANPAIAAADIVHLHWPSWAVTPRMIRHLADAGKQVFITLHDMWMFTGGCHYASGCRQFETACMKCPQIADGLGLASAGFEDKLAAFGGGLPNFSVITLCKWMRDQAASSRILSDAPIYLIPNPIETDTFIPLDREVLRGQFGLTDKDVVLIFGNYNNSEFRKGANILVDTLAELAESGFAHRVEGRVVFLVFGKDSSFDVPEPFYCIDVGSVDGDDVLAGLYSIADMLCFPSIEDNYPNTIVEAAACGTPTVAFRAGGMVDMVEHGRTGWIVDEVGSAVALAKGVEDATDALHGNRQVRDACREHVLAENPMSVIGRKLEAAYRSALGLDTDGSDVAEASASQSAGKAGSTADSVRRDQKIATQVLSHVLNRADEVMGSEFLKTPIRRFLQNNCGPDIEFKVEHYRRYNPAGTAGGRTRLLTVRSFHEHHSAYSGPYQFVRHLPAETFDVSNEMVPLGKDLVLSEDTRKQVASLGKLFGIQPFGSHPNAWAAEWEIARRLRQEAFDIVHFIDGELAGWLISRLPDSFFAGGVRPQLITTLHQPDELAAEWGNAAALRRFDRICAMADDQAKFLSGMIPDVPVDVVPHGVDCDFFCPSPEAEGGATVEGDGKPYRLLSVGHWLRDYEKAFAAIALLREEGFDIHYRVVCHSMDEADVPSFVTLLKGISDEELRQEYRDADALFMPLKWATANNALLESMACGTPVVSTSVGGVPEYVDENAGLICQSSPEDYAAALKTLLGDAGRRQEMGQAARSWAETFDWRRIGEQFADLYSAILTDADARLVDAL